MPWVDAKDAPVRSQLRLPGWPVSTGAVEAHMRRVIHLLAAGLA